MECRWNLVMAHMNKKESETEITYIAHLRPTKVQLKEIIKNTVFPLDQNDIEKVLATL